VVLSMLLHTLVVVLFGTSTGGGAARRGFWDPSGDVAAPFAEPERIQACAGRRHERAGIGIATAFREQGLGASQYTAATGRRSTHRITGDDEGCSERAYAGCNRNRARDS
jgi:hypothetical protein